MRPSQIRRSALAVLVLLLALVAPVAPATADDAGGAAPVITLASGTVSPTNALDLYFNVTFSSDPSNFNSMDDIRIEGTAGAITGDITPIGSRVFLVRVRPGTDGTIRVRVAPGAWTVDGQPGVEAVSETVIVDRTGPKWVDHFDLTAATSGTSTTVDYPISATDPNGPVTVSCDPPSGSSFPLGRRYVLCTATDLVGNSSEAGFYVTTVPSGFSYWVGERSGFGIGPSGAAGTYPSTLTVSAAPRVVTDVEVNVRFSHPEPSHLDMVLVGPQGKSVMLMSDVACGSSTGYIDLRFSDDGDALPATAPLSSGSYRPTNYSSDCVGSAADDLTGVDPTWSDSLSVFDGMLHTGDWKLYVWDDSTGTGGYLEMWQLVLRTEAAVVPSISNPGGRTFEKGRSFELQLSVSGSPTPTISLEGDLPEGLTLDGDTISGVATESGFFPLTIVADNGVGAPAMRSFWMTVIEEATITSAASATAALGTSFSHTFAAEGYPAPDLTVTADELPEGLSLVDGVLSGTPTETGTFTVDVHAANMHGTDDQSFELTVVEAPAGPTIAIAGPGALSRGANATWTVSFDRPVSGLSASDFELSGTATTGTAELISGPQHFGFRVPVTSDGTVELELPDWAWQDADGFLGRGASGPTITFDRTGPVVDPIEPLVVQLPEGQSSVEVTIPVPTASDATEVSSVNCDLPPGTSLGRGLRKFSCTATDPLGNSTTVSSTVYVVPAGEGLRAGVSTGAITIREYEAADPYPSVIPISAPGRVVTDVNVDLRLEHSFVSDVDILLQGPDGRAVMILSDVGCEADGVWDLVIDQQAAVSMPDSAPMSSGTFRPTNHNPSLDCANASDYFSGGAPITWSNSLDAFNDTFAHGEWRLWVYDDNTLDWGAIPHWAINISTIPATAPGLTGPAELELRAGEAVEHRIASSGAPSPQITVLEGTLPEGLELVDGVLEGTPTEAGEFTITFGASNGAGPDVSQVVTLVIFESPEITSAATATAAVGTPFSFPIATTGFPTPEVTVDAITLPAGVRLEDGELTGTPLESGEFTVELTASNGFEPDDVQELELLVLEAPAGPVIARAEGQAEATSSQPIEFTITFAEEPVGFEAADLELQGDSSGGTVALAGGPLVWTASVSGLESDGRVRLSLPFGAWADDEGFLGAGATGPEVRLDTQAPVLESPAPASGRIAVTTEPGQPGAHVEFEPRLADVQVLGARLLPTAVGDGPVTCSPASGSFFLIGSTPVECSSTDDAGNTGRVSFAVVVTDEEAPVIDAVEDLTVQLAEGESTVAVDFELPAASDNSGEVEVSCDLEPGAELAEGEHRVSCLAEDPSGNAAGSSFAVTVLAAEGGEEDGSEDKDSSEEDGAKDEEDDLATTGVFLLLPAGLAVLLLGTGVTLATIRRRQED